MPSPPVNGDTPRSRKERVLALMRANRLTEAAALCEEVVRNENNAGAWHLLGVIRGMQSNLLEAEHCSREAIRLHPGYTDAYCNLGAALRAQGRLDEAIPALRQALKLQPGHVETLYNLGLTLAADQRYDEAIESLGEVVRLNPDHAEAHLYLGAALASTGRTEEAVASFRRVLTLQPGHVAAHVCLGNALVDMGKMEEAVANYRQALQQQPYDTETLNNLGNALSELGQMDEAIATYRQILEVDRRYLAAYHNLGRILLDLERIAEATEIYRSAVQNAPDHVGALSDLAAVLSRQNNYDEAIACYRRALEIQPDDAETLYNLGNALRAVGKLPEAIDHYRKAIRLKPTDADTHMNLALSCLALAMFRDGWKEYDWQWRRENAAARRFEPSAWDGTDLGGRDVFLDSEQGIGDELFFLRFVPWLKRLNAGQVIYSPSTKIWSLLSRCKILDRLAPPDERPTGTQFAFSVGDLPRLLGMESVDQIPSPVELAAQPAHVAAVRQKLDECGTPPFLGITWRGGTTKKNALYKEIPLERLAACLRESHTTVLVLQRNPNPGEVETFARLLGRPVHDFSAFNENLEQMLALLSLLDDYIGVSNANMHLRAGVGKTARVLVPAPPEWRWMAEGKESPWFPGFTVYRQGYDGSWDKAFAELVVDLNKSLS